MIMCIAQVVNRPGRTRRVVEMKIDEMPAGRETDARVAEAMGYELCTMGEAIALTNAAFPDRPGWETWYSRDWYVIEDQIPDTGLAALPYYSADLDDAAGEVVEKMKELDFWWSATYKEPAWIEDKWQAAYFVTFRCVRGGNNRETRTAFALELPHAICRAALKVLEKEDV